MCCHALSRACVLCPAQVSISTDPYAVFQDAEWALMIGAKPRGPGQERADLLDQNGRIFVEQVGWCFDKDGGPGAGERGWCWRGKREGGTGRRDWGRKGMLGLPGRGLWLPCRPCTSSMGARGGGVG